jgi:hypothetical protein
MNILTYFVSVMRLNSIEFRLIIIKQLLLISCHKNFNIIQNFVHRIHKIFQNIIFLFSIF